ncbi:MAG: thioredoxin family protein [Akkermansia sp.]|nr:thioredoxin family protein [Akkermansia sp.]
MRRSMGYFLGAALAACVLPAAALDWQVNLEAALEQAAGQGKAVLVFFTGSDWCVYCRELEGKVLATPEFAEYAGPRFVCVEMDLPHKPLLSPGQLEYNRGVAKRYGVTGYPTLLVLDAAGGLAGGFIGGKPELPYVREMLDTALQNVQDLPRLQQLQGQERVRALHNLYRTFKQLEKLGRANEYRKLLLEADTENVTGIHDELKAHRLLEDYRTRLRAAADPDAELQIIAAGLADCTYPEVRVELLNRKVQIMQARVQTMDDLMAMKEVMLESARQIPEHAPAMVDSVEAVFRDPQGLLELIKSQRKGN